MKTKLVSMSLKKVDSNPFRDLETYPWIEAKIADLIKSIDATDFWSNIVARQVGDRYQIAYGHHRIEALRRVLGEDGEIQLLVRGLSDTQMFKMMVNENSDVYGTQALTSVGAVTGLLQGLADGRFDDFPKIEPYKGIWREAPSAVQKNGEVFPAGKTSGVFYNAATIAEYCDWSEIEAAQALAVAEAIELGVVDLTMIAGLGLSVAATFVTTANRAVRDAAKAAKKEEEERENARKATEERIRQEEVAKKAHEEAKKAADEKAKKAAETRAKEAEKSAANAEKDRLKRVEEYEKNEIKKIAAEKNAEVKKKQAKAAIKNAAIEAGDEPISKRAAREAINEESRKEAKENNEEDLAKQKKSKFNRTNENIEWASWSWNPVTGCEHGCEYCYAREMSKRFDGHFNPEFHEDRLNAPANTKPIENDVGGKNVFVCSMADLFGSWVPNEWIARVLDQVKANPQWNFLFLTKNPRRLPVFDFPQNAWIGTTIDVQSRVECAEKYMEQVSGAVRFISVEPMLEPIRLSKPEIFDWVIIGARSKTSSGPEFQPDGRWVLNLTNQAHGAGCKVYWKPNLSIRLREYPEVENAG